MTQPGPSNTFAAHFKTNRNVQGSSLFARDIIPIQVDGAPEQELVSRNEIFNNRHDAGVSVLNYLKKFFEDLLVGRTDYDNLMQSTIDLKIVTISGCTEKVDFAFDVQLGEFPAS